MTTQDFDTARAIERPAIRVGERYEFYSTMQQEYLPPGERIRNYTGQMVTVIGGDEREFVSDEDDVMFKVRADDGFEFNAWDDELNGWFRDTGQFFWPDATYGPDHDRTFLSNERD